MINGKTCEVCGIRPAMMLFKSMTNGATKEQYVCLECSASMQIFNIGDLNGGGQSFSIDPSQIIASLFKGAGIGNMSPQQQQNNARGVQNPQIPNRTCSCGVSDIDIRKNLKFGCAVCYDTFKDVVESFLAVHLPGVHSHRGKSTGTPAGAGNGATSAGSDVLALREQLRLAVEREDYALAQEIKNKIEGLSK